MRLQFGWRRLVKGLIFFSVLCVVLVEASFFLFVRLHYLGCVWHGCDYGCDSFSCGCTGEADSLVKLNQF
jgi:hypothetical protein